MFDTVFGLPVHVLTVHAVVVLLPLLALAAAAVAAHGPWRRTLALPLAAASFAASTLTWVAVESGEALNVRLGVPPAALEHTGLGASLHLFALGLTAALVVLGVLARRPRPARAVVAVGAVLVLASAALLTWRAVLVGHSGSAAVWGDVVENTPAPTG